MVIGAETPVDAKGTVKTHAIYPGCQDAPVAAATYNPSTSILEQSDWTWG